MSTIAIITIAAGGNVPPVIAIGRALIARGHRVHVLGQEILRTRLETEGFDFTALRSTEFWGDRRTGSSVPAAVSSAVRLAASRDIRREVSTGLAQIAPDAALVDVLMPSAVLGSRDAGVPTAVLFHTYYEYWIKGFASGPLGWFIRVRGMNVRKAWDSAQVQLVTCDVDFDPAARRLDPLRAPTWVGAVAQGAPSGPAEKPPLVLVSLSSTWMPGQTDTYQRIITALGTLPVRGLVTLGGVKPDREFTVPTNVDVRDYAPHDQILPSASLVVGHGGHATTFAALAHDKPLVVLPMHPLMDQPMVAASVVDAGAGLMLKPTASSEQIARTIAAVLDDPQILRSVQSIGARLRGSDAAATAATRLLELAVPTRTPADRSEPV